MLLLVTEIKGCHSAGTARREFLTSSVICASSEGENLLSRMQITSSLPGFNLSLIGADIGLFCANLNFYYCYPIVDL